MGSNNCTYGGTIQGKYCSSYQSTYGRTIQENYGSSGPCLWLRSRGFKLNKVLVHFSNLLRTKDTPTVVRTAEPSKKNMVAPTSLRTAVPYKKNMWYGQVLYSREVVLYEMGPGVVCNEKCCPWALGGSVSLRFAAFFNCVGVYYVLSQLASYPPPPKNIEQGIYGYVHSLKYFR